MTGLSKRQLAAIARRYGFAVPAPMSNPWTGATSHVYPAGDVVVKVAFGTADAISAVTIDAAMNQVARELGVRTSELLAFDDAMDIVPVPFALYRRVQDTVPLQDLRQAGHIFDRAWQAVGRELALVHAVPEGTPMPLGLRTFRQSPEVDPRPWVDELLQHGLLGDRDADWLQCLLHMLAPAALENVPLRLCHGDLNGSNVLVPPAAGVPCTLIDWAGVGWLDPVWDFAGVSLALVPHLLAGHRAVAPLPGDDTAEARICWCQVQMRLLNARSRMDAPSAHSELARDIAQIRAFASSQGWER